MEQIQGRGVEPHKQGLGERKEGDDGRRGRGERGDDGKATD